MQEIHPTTKDILQKNLKTIISVMREHQLVKAEITYCGSGDSGETEYTRVFDATNTELRMDRLDKIHLPVVDMTSVWSSEGFQLRLKELNLNLQQALESVTEQYLEVDNRCGYENNEGGGGQLDIDAVTGTVSLDHYKNETTQTYTSSSMQGIL